MVSSKLKLDHGKIPYFGLDFFLNERLHLAENLWNLAAFFGARCLFADNLFNIYKNSLFSCEISGVSENT